jgi:3-hydroxybutyryl-CoA dehydrogenase
MVIGTDDIVTIGVVGAGAMGRGIAQIGLQAGLKVILHDLDETGLSAARDEIFARIARLVQKGQLSPSAAARARDNLALAPDLSALTPAAVVIEAIVEKLEPKRALFAALEQVVSPHTVLATNTSSLSVAAIAAGCARRERVCGMHFFNPVPVMRLVEVVDTPDTSPEVVELAKALARRLGKSPVQVKDVPGFLVNLLGRAYVTEALHIQLEGVASVEVIDRVMREAAGFRMGPFELMDLTGIDVNFPATTAIYQGFQHDPRLKTTILHESLFNAGSFGQKTGKGYHPYLDNARVAGRGNEVSALDNPSVFLVDDAAALADLASRGLRLASRDSADILLIAPIGEDATTVTAQRRLDPSRVVAVDLTAIERSFVTLMTPPGGRERAERLAACLRGLGCSVAVIGDSPGFVAPRIISMIANLGCEVAQMGIGAPEDIDVAMKLAQNYPRGPLEWAEWFGPARIYETLRALQDATGSDRYRPSLWLRRRVLLGLPIHMAI